MGIFVAFAPRRISRGKFLRLLWASASASESEVHGRAFKGDTGESDNPDMRIADAWFDNLEGLGLGHGDIDPTGKEHGE